jgi:DNA-binding transcriptional regulator YiaG
VKAKESVTVTSAVTNTTDISVAWNAFELRQLRYRLGWCRAEMARFMKLNPELVSAWETGRFQPTEEHCKALLAILNQAETYAEKVQRRPIAEVVMRDRGLSQIHDLEVIDVVTGKA